MTFELCGLFAFFISKLLFISKTAKQTLRAVVEIVLDVV